MYRHTTGDKDSKSNDGDFKSGKYYNKVYNDDKKSQQSRTSSSRSARSRSSKGSNAEEGDTVLNLESNPAPVQTETAENFNIAESLDPRKQMAEEETPAPAPVL
jgi:hypothetical protein